MKPVVPNAVKGFQEALIGRHQPQYQPLPAQVNDEGLVLTAWELEPEEIAHLNVGGTLLLWVHTGGGHFPPVALEVQEAAPAVPIVSDPDHRG